MKTVLLASDSFKGTLSSKEIIEIAAAVIRERFSSEWSLDALEIADGGEGTLDALFKVLGGERVEVPTLDAEGNAVQAPLLLRGDEAYLEVASIVGLPMIKGSIDPLRRSTRGLAVLIKEAIHRGAKKITVGLGGSSTSEMGIGMLQELGLDFHAEEKVTMANVDTIQKLSWGRLPKNIAGVRFTCLSDVNSPLLGENGAVKAYGPQKGYGPYIEGMEAKMGHLASLSESLLRKDFSSFPGAGAAGGLGFAFKAFLGADLISGIDAVLDLCRFQQKAEKADLVITGEGCFDRQSVQGKAISGISKRTDPRKLVILCGKSKMPSFPLPVYETSRPGESFEEIKSHAKEEYASALAGILESR